MLPLFALQCPMETAIMSEYKPVFYQASGSPIVAVRLPADFGARQAGPAMERFRHGQDLLALAAPFLS